MRKRLPAFVAAALCISVIPASAQRRPVPVPNTGMWAVGGSLGGGAPRTPNLAGGVDLAANVERYLTPRFSVRGQLGGALNDVDGRGFTRAINPFFMEGNVVYNWEGGVWHPYATGGVGLYRYGSFDRLRPDASDAFPGVNVGGGIEYFANRLLTVTGELLIHDVGQIRTPLPALDQGQFWTLTVGVKRYF